MDGWPDGRMDVTWFHFACERRTGHSGSAKGTGGEEMMEHRFRDIFALREGEQSHFFQAKVHVCLCFCVCVSAVRK